MGENDDDDRKKSENDDKERIEGDDDDYDSKKKGEDQNRGVRTVSSKVRMFWRVRAMKACLVSVMVNKL
jgi:hypothetical protein